MKKLVIASHNKHKVEEIRAILPGEYELLSLSDINFNDSIPETSDTFEGNAMQKIRYVADKIGIEGFADDSGLEVKALSGGPGVFSARYAGENGNHQKNNDKLLKELQGIDDREAQFRTVIALIFNGKEYFFEGIVKGRIIHELKGTQGFGYDPLFVPDGYEQSFAEMDAGLKNTISHRARAVQKMMAFLRNESGDFQPRVEYC